MQLLLRLDEICMLDLGQCKTLRLTLTNSTSQLDDSQPRKHKRKSNPSQDAESQSSCDVAFPKCLEEKIEHKQLAPKVLSISKARGNLWQSLGH